MGMVAVACCATAVTSLPIAMTTSGRKAMKFVHDRRNAFKQPLSVSQVEDEVLAFDVASAPQLAYKSPAIGAHGP